LSNYLSPFDATVVKRIAESGAVCLGKTSCDEFAMGSANQNCAFGPCLNPWDKKAIPGGSSGGSAALVGAGHVSFATGTDTGGSIRQPAAMCGVTGIKPTYGLVSRWGIIAYASSLDQAGPIANSAYDCGLVLNAMVGFDPRDSTSQRSESVDYCALMNSDNEKIGTKPLEDIVLGIPTEYSNAIYSQDVALAFQESIRTYEKLGAIIKEVSLPHANHSVAAYYVIAPAEASSNLSRFDGVKFGFRNSQADTLEDLYFDTRSEVLEKKSKEGYLLEPSFYLMVITMRTIIKLLKFGVWFSVILNRLLKAVTFYFPHLLPFLPGIWTDNLISGQILIRQRVFRRNIWQIYLRSVRA